MSGATATTTATATAAGAATAPVQPRERHRYRIDFSVEGRIRFLSHLEMQDTLLQALRRAGARFALSEGMKPKPVIKLALPRPVGVASWGEIAEVDLATAPDPDELALSLSSQLPEGMALVAITRAADGEKAAARRVAGAWYRVAFVVSAGVDVRAAVEAFIASDSVTVHRKTPKHDRQVDVRAFVHDLRVLDDDAAAHNASSSDDDTVACVRFYARLSQTDGSVKPEEVVRALASVAGSSFTTRTIVRESIAIADVVGQAVDPALVGADVPEGPPRPWGAC